tara:strand:+ start:282 stop:542 length:261 start_codon:yes stop_codon:yes gene_type:complete
MSISNHYKHVDIHSYETTHRAMLQASTDELTARGYAKVLEEDELKVLAEYHLEKFKNWMRPLMNPDYISTEITIQMPPVELPASKK